MPINSHGFCRIRAYLAIRLQLRNGLRVGVITKFTPAIVQAAELKCQAYSYNVTVFVAAQQQLKDTVRFCTNSENFCVLGVDPTYNLGQFYLTVTIPTEM